MYRCRISVRNLILKPEKRNGVIALDCEVYVCILKIIKNKNQFKKCNNIERIITVIL